MWFQQCWVAHVLSGSLSNDYQTARASRGGQSISTGLSLALNLNWLSASARLGQMGLPALLAVPVWTRLALLHLRVCLVALASWKAAIRC